MSPERRQRLDALGFVWDLLIPQWENGFRFLEIFHQREGHCRVSQYHREQSFRLGLWVAVQRRTRDSMPSERRQRLDALSFVWDPLTAQWEEGLRCFTVYYQREGHCLVPALHREQGFRLGQWVSGQRKNKDALSPERRERLDSFGFVWDVLTRRWEEGFRFLEIFYQRERHCRVPERHREQGYRLGGWVGSQRTNKAALSPERRQRLETIGFVWDVPTTKWEEWFRALQSYRQREGHCRVPTNHWEQGYWLGQWVANQRQNKETMSPERRQQLDALGFVWKVR